ncbi:MAG: ribosome maturation factor RimM [Methylosarcina sp.]
MTESQNKNIGVGKISGVFGLRGWVKVYSYTDPKENILSYSPWMLKKGSDIRICKVVDGKLQGKTIVAQLEGIMDRDQAGSLIDFDVYILKSQLSIAEEGEYYWSDLIGLAVENIAGVQLGVVDSILETGANDVLVVKGQRERAIPFLQGKTILNVNLDAGVIIVDWDPEF